jgi:GT2 family glycosyltransferase
MKKNIQGNYTTHLDTKNFAIRADILKRLKFNSELLACEDLDLAIRLRLERVKIYFLPDLLVAHYHDASVKALISTQLSQGYSAAAIVASYQKNSKFIEVFNHDNSLNFTGLRNYILFLPWAVWQFIFHPVIAPYRVLADLAWKIGVIKFKLN